MRARSGTVGESRGAADAIEASAGLSEDVLLKVGVEIGLPDLSVSAVAHRLGVSRAAIHRHVSGWRGLEELVGEHLITSFQVPADRGQPVEELLLEVASALRGFCLRVPGMAAYLATRFPRSESSARVLERICALLVTRGFSPARALRIETAVASQAIALTRSEIESVEFMTADIDGYHEYVTRIEEVFGSLPNLGAAWPQIKSDDFEAHFMWLMRCLIIGVLAAEIE